MIWPPWSTICTRKAGKMLDLFHQVLEKWIRVLQSFEVKWYIHTYLCMKLFILHIYISLWTHGVEPLWYISIPYSLSFLMLNLLNFFFFAQLFRVDLCPFNSVCNHFWHFSLPARITRCSRLASLIFPAPNLDSGTSPKSPHSFY